MYVADGGLEMGITDEFVVKFKPDISRQQKDEWIKKHLAVLKQETELYILMSVPNRTVTTNTTVTGCGDINVQNVTVTNGAKLTLDAAGEVNIISDFEVAAGSELEIKQ